MSGLMSVDKKKVLHIDRNDYYGGAAASLTLDQVREPARRLVGSFRQRSAPPLRARHRKAPRRARPEQLGGLLTVWSRVAVATVVQEVRAA
jgi:RAB protein geranylgeranyltransferase component A